MGLQDIARIDGWVRTPQPEPSLEWMSRRAFPDEDPTDPSEEEPSEEEPSEESGSDSDSDPTQASDSPSWVPALESDSALGYEARQQSEDVEQLPIESQLYNAPTASSTVPILGAAVSGSDGFQTLSPEAATADSGVAESESGVAESESPDEALSSSDFEDEEEGSLFDRIYAAPPEELCRCVILGSEKQSCPGQAQSCANL